MNNKQIETIMSRFDSGKCFQGVYAADMLPIYPLNNERCCYIVNTEDHTEPGEHWVSFFFPGDDGCPEYFDSYGLMPLLSIFYEFLGKRDFLFNNITLQAPLSNVCGQYCLFFLMGRLSGISFVDLIEIFRKDDPYSNDAFVNSVINDLFGVHLKQYNNNFMGKQISRIFQPNYQLTQYET